MAQKIRQIISTLAIDVKSLNIDDRTSFRYLADKFRDKIGYFLRLESRSREFTKDLSIWKPIHCVELEEVATNACGYKDDYNTLLKSKIKIPEAYNTPYGLLIKVLTIDSRYKFTQIASNQYKDYTTLRYGGSNLLFWLEDGHIFIPNSSLEAVKVLIIPKEPAEVDNLNNPCNCLYPLDGEVNYSDYLITLAKKEVLAELFPGKSITQDEKGNDNTNSK